MKSLYFFYHVPKTGGQSLRDHFNRTLTPHEEFIHLGPTGLRDAEKLGLKPFEERTQAERDRAVVMLGHQLFFKYSKAVHHDRLREITILRSPAGHVVSRFNQAMRVAESRGLPEQSFEEWYAEGKSNGQFQFLTKRLGLRIEGKAPSKEALIERLDSFWLVGVLEKLDVLAPLIFKSIGIDSETYERTNVTGKDFQRRLKLDEGLKKELEADNQIDMELYQLWKSRQEEVENRLQGEIAQLT